MIAWDDAEVGPGKWEPQIREALVGANVAVLLVTIDSLASSYIMEKELPLLMARDGQLQFLWIAVSAANYRFTDLEAWQCANDPDRPLDSLGRPERASMCVRICGKIEEAMRAQQTSAGTNPDA